MLASKIKTDAYENDDLEKWPRKVKYIYVYIYIYIQETEYTQESVGLFLQLGANVFFKVGRKKCIPVCISS